MKKVVILPLLISINIVLPLQLPKTFQRCNRNSNDFNDCLNKAIEHALRQTTKPFPRIGIPSLHPLEIPSMVIGEGKGAVNVVQNYKNIKLYGLTDAKVLTTKVDFDKKLLTVNCFIPELKQICDYDFNGRILLLPIVGKGDGLLRLERVKADNLIEFEEFTKNNQKFYKPIKTTVKLNPEHVFMQFNNLFMGDELLSNNTNQVLNDNWKEVFDDVKEGYEKIYGDIITQIATNVFTQIPLDDIFLTN